MYARLIGFISKHNLLSESQFGFRKNRSTELATSFLTNKLLEGIEDGNISIGIFLDLSKAFDTVNHNILIHKLEHCGVRGIALEWFKSYLSNRKQSVSYNSATSLEKPIITCGVPQGSVLGPLLFIIYVNDICNTSDIISFCLAVNDTSLVYSHKNVNVAVNNLNIELVKISTWLKANKLCINLLKCNYIIFCTAQKRYNQSVPLVLDGVGLNKLEHTKFLGLEIDEHLSWRNHISEVTSKIAKNIGIINHLRKLVPGYILLTLYNCLVLPYLNYSILTWGGSLSQCNKLLTLQKRAVRIISNAGFREHTAPLFFNLKILQIIDLYHLNLGKVMYKFMTNALPSCFSSFFTLTSKVHSYNTRSTAKTNLFVSRQRTSLYQKSFV